MPRKSKTKNRKSSTKRQRFGTSLKLSRLCYWLVLVALVKVVALTTLAVDFPSLAQVTDMVRGQEAQEAAPAPPLLAANVAVAAEGNQTEPAAPDPQASSMTRDALQRKQDDLNRQETSLRQLEQQIDTKLVQLQELEAKIQRMLEDAQELKDKKLRHLVDVYSNMKAKQAAAVIETLDQKIAVKILAGMRGRQAGEILTFVQPAKAAKLSEALTRMQIPFE